MLDAPERGTVVGGEVLRITDTAVFIDVGGKRDAFFPSYELELLNDETVSRGDELPIYIKGYAEGGQLLDGSLEKGLASRDWLEAQSYLDENTTAEIVIIGYNKGGLLASFGRLEGFIPNSHIPNLGYGSKRQSHKASMEGERVSAKVVEVNQERRRLILSITEAQKEQRQAKLRTLAKGDIVHGRVVNLAKFGAFVDLGQDLTGLIHISQLAHHYVDNPSEVISVGDEVEAKIHKINYEKERIGLSRKALLPSPWVEFAETHEPGQLLEVTIRNTTDFGAFAEINDVITGLIHVSEYPTWMKGSEALREGDIVLAAIKSIDPDRERVGLSLKQVTYEQEMDWLQKHKSGKDEAPTPATADAQEAEEAEEAQEPTATTATVEADNADSVAEVETEGTEEAEMVTEEVETEETEMVTAETETEDAVEDVETESEATSPADDVNSAEAEEAEVADEETDTDTDEDESTPAIPEAVA